ncbi:MAG: hypothetical protein ACRC9L_04580 [Brevinema sp.]
MKKLLAFVLISVCMLSLVACGEQSSKETVTVYSYSGENEQYSIINGVIVLSEKDDIVYGGELKAKEDQITDLVSETMELYILSDNKEIPLTSFVSVDHTGDGFELSNPGSRAAEFSEDEKENLIENLYFKISIETLDGEKTVSDIKMNVIDITGMFED